MNTPRDRIDDEMLLRLLRENEPVAAMYGNCGRRQNGRRQNNGTERAENREGRRSGEERTGGCGCRNNSSTRRNRNMESREARRTSCGDEESSESHCEHNHTECGDTSSRSDSCNESCINHPRMCGFPLAMAYVPEQEWEGIMDDEEALRRGTLFEKLDLPWYHSACDDEGGKCGDKR